MKKKIMIKKIQKMKMKIKNNHKNKYLIIY